MSYVSRFPEEALPRFNAYRRLNNNRPRLWSIIENEADGTQLAAYASLFWPDFIEVRGCVLLAEHYYEEAFSATWESLHGDQRRIELLLNHVHVGALCAQRERDLDPRVETMVGEGLAKSWRCALGHRFSDRTFDVILTQATTDAEAEITFCTLREGVGSDDRSSIIMRRSPTRGEAPE
jgi:hypothetical protein